MKLRNLFLGACSLVLAFTACDELMQLGGGSGNPDLSVDTTEMEFEVAGGDQTLTLSSTRAWKVETDADWVTVDPASGDAGEDQTVTVSVLENTGLDRSVDLKFTIGMISRYLTVNQKGPSGSADALIAYANDFDIEKAQNNSGWPYLDSNTDLWDNKKGTGASTVTYEYGGKMSVRTSGKLSNNNEGFSHYSGSGMNKVFFGAATSIFKINNITLGSGNNYTLSYGGQKYLQGADCNYSFDEMKVYVSNDAQKWVPVTMAFPADADIDGDWNLATGNFTLPEGTSTLSIAFVCTASSAYSIDDVLLQVSDNAGQDIDFSTGITIDGTTSGGNTGGDTGGSTGGDTTKPSTLKKVTVAEFLAAAEDDTWYELTGEIISIAKETYGNFTIKDATGEIYIYGMTNGWVGSNNQSFSQIGLKVGDTVTLGTKRTSYNGTAQGGGSSIPAYYISHVAGEGSGNQGGSNDDDDNGDDDNTGNVTPVGGNSDDFAALTSSRYYEASLTTPNGWVLNNCQVHTYGTANSNDTFAYVPEGNKAVCMNGKTAAAGKVTSPVIAGGCEALSFNYCYPFSESNGVSIKVEILQNDAVVKSFDVVNKTAAKYEVCSHTEQIGVTGNFTIRFSNNSPSNNSSSNKDRYSIWNITWTSKAE